MSRPARMAAVALLPALFGALGAERSWYELAASLVVLWAGWTILIAAAFVFIERGRD